MIQVAKFLSGERDYKNLDGPTGPCVYPALHLYIHAALYKITNNGLDIRLAQVIYAGLYGATLTIVLACYRRVNAPPWLLVPLVLSKRMHSIFLLRLFNDCWATFFFWVSVYGATKKNWTMMTFSWVLALNVKMTMLLPFPALLLILVQDAGVELTVILLLLGGFFTIVLAVPFMFSPENFFIYLGQAFDLGRQFLYKWTVNWRFVDEETFLSKSFAYTLLAVHASLLMVSAHYKWVRPSSKGIIHFAEMHLLDSFSGFENVQIMSRLTPQFVMDAMLGSIALGMMCARSLHYQFFAYICWATPYLLWRSGSSPLVVLGGWALQEVAWLTYPSTSWSSFTCVALLALQTASSWIALPSEYPPLQPGELQAGDGGEEEEEE